MAPDKLRKLLALLGQLGHDNENVRANAGLAAHRLLREQGMVWADVVGVAKRSKPDREPLVNDDDLGAVLEMAECYASNDWEKGFVADIRERFDRFGSRTRMSEKQWAVLRRIARMEN